MDDSGLSFRSNPEYQRSLIIRYIFLYKISFKLNKDCPLSSQQMKCEEVTIHILWNRLRIFIRAHNSTKNGRKMEGKEKSSSTARGIRKLEKPEDYDEWIREVQASTVKGFRPLANHSSLAIPLLSMPRPVVENINPNCSFLPPANDTSAKIIW